MSLSTLSVGSALFLLASGLLWQRACKSPPPWHAELAVLGQPRLKKLPGTAVVCGGSIAGSVTARILADHFERVILVDPEVGKNDESKTRILQYNAFHIILCLFVAGARRLWPNFDAEIQAAGARSVSAESHTHYSGIPILFPRSFFPDTVSLRRPKLLTEHPTATSIEVVSGSVRGFEPSGDMSSIHSVTIRKTDGTQLSLNEISFVADCTGTTQSGFKWLKAAGFSLPDIRSSYNGNMRYATLCFTVTPELEAKLSIPEGSKNDGIVYANLPHSDFGCFILALMKTEKDTMQLLFSDSGEGESDMPRVASDVIPYLQRFPGHAPIPAWFMETVTLLCEHGEPSFTHTKIPSQSYIQYHRVPIKDLPRNFVAIGDSTQQLNSVYGQGCSKVVLNGIALNALLHSVNSTNYAFPTCEPMQGETHDTGRFVRWFSGKLLNAATQDEEVAGALWSVRHLLSADTAILAPTVLWKILWARSPF
ncbi:hypothetical protein C8R46DRAFT_1122944 [Mycena filopes]|nr:hypothetical protein C8R46DRAFT_1122944 [Mycena filopes]